MNTDPWSELGSVPPRDLGDARVNAHYASQPLAAAAYALLPMEEDHSHTNLLWSAEHALFIGRPLPRGGRCFLDIARLRAGLLSETGTKAALDLEGTTLASAFEGMAELLREVGEEVPAGGLELPSYDLPDAPLTSGARFEAPRAALAELDRWFAIGGQILPEISRAQLEDAEVRGWPHHFDMAALSTLDEGKSAEDARSVNVGLSPGDGSYDEPYFYVTPWPAPARNALPSLPGAVQWHTDGFTAAVLTASQILEAKRGTADLRGVLQQTVTAALELLA